MRITSAPPRVAARTVKLRRRPSRRLFLVGLVLLLAVSAAAIFLSSAILHPAHAAPTRYGTDPARMQSAVTAAGWPQQNGIWCGIADIAAIVDYRNPGHAIDQVAVVNYLNSPAAKSAWGTPAQNLNVAWGPGFQSDISRDGGTDPRTMAAGLSALGNGSYHQLVDYHNSYNATAHFVADLVRTKEPITVFVNAASHSVLVSAVFAYGDPTNLNNVTALEVYDSGAGRNEGVQLNRVQQVSLNAWLWWYAYYGAAYNENIYDGRHALDPDPSVGPYTYDPSQGRNVHLWVGHFVYIRPGRSGEASSGVSPDWAFNQDGALIRGFGGEVPAGYGGPSVPMYVPPPPPPTPRPPTPTPTNTPRPTATPHQPRPPTDIPDFPTATAPAAGAPQSTPAPGSLFGLSLQSICFGAPCAGPQVLAMVALGGASSLGATILLLVGVVMVRRRRKAARERAPGASRETSPSDTRQPANEVDRETATAPQDAVAVAGGSADAANGAPGDIPGAATASSGADGDTAGNLPEETGPLARLARASDRLVQLAETTEPTQASDGSPTLDAAVADVADANDSQDAKVVVNAPAPVQGGATAEPVSGTAAGDASPDAPPA